MESWRRDDEPLKACGDRLFSHFITLLCSANWTAKCFDCGLACTISSLLVEGLGVGVRVAVQTGWPPSQPMTHVQRRRLHIGFTTGGQSRTHYYSDRSESPPWAQLRRNTVLSSFALFTMWIKWPGPGEFTLSYIWKATQSDVEKVWLRVASLTICRPQLSQAANRTAPFNGHQHCLSALHCLYILYVLKSALKLVIVK